MSDHVEASLHTSAVEHAIRLMQPAVGAQGPGPVVAGYVDLLGRRDPIGSSFIQRAMRSRLIPRIYEHLWRPLASRAFYGVFGPSLAKEYRIALDMLDISPGEQVLDVGCGPGNFTRRFARAAGGGLVVGFDASETMLAAAARRGVSGNLAYVRGDACSLPFAEASFDAVCCFGTLHLIEGPMKAVDEMTRVLVPGGRLGVMATWRRRDRSPLRLRGARVFGRDELIGALEDRGLIGVEQQVAGWGQFVSAHKAKG